MEEILASIRRIIADDQTLAIVTPPQPAPVQRLHPEPEAVPVPALDPDSPRPMAPHGSVAAPQFPSPEPVLSETAAHPLVPGEVAPHHPAETVAEDVATEPMEYRPEPVHDEPMIPASPVPEPMAPESSLPDAEPGSSHQASIQPPHHPEPRPEPTAAEPIPAASGAPLFSSATHRSVASAFNVLAASRLADNSEELMALARDMIRPMLRAWIDENLPMMVERMVRDEIERVARGGP